jgi:hypothetical protein
MSELTHVELRWVKKRVENWINYRRFEEGDRLLNGAKSSAEAGFSRG